MIWRDRAACPGTSVDFFDPEQTNQALMICHDCPVKTECLDDALQLTSKDDAGGVWGGHTKAERDRMRPKRRRPLDPCGTYGAYRRHIANKEPACEPCKDANRDA